MERDTRGVLASVLQLMGLLDVEEQSMAQSAMGLNLGTGLGLRADEKEGGNMAGTEPLPETNLDEFSISRASVASSTDLSVKLVTASEVKLDPEDRQVISLARRYDVIRLGEWWKDVQDQLSSEGIRLIEADHYTLEYNLRDSFDAAAAVQLEQLDLRRETKRAAEDQNRAFVNGILDQKQQQIKAEYLKRKAKRSAASSIGGPKVATINK
jgi:hypothetical protein